MSIKNIIRSLDFFSTLDSEEVDLLVSISTLHHYNSECILQYENQESRKLLFLTSGLAEAYKIDKHDNEIFLYYVYENTLLSEISSIKSDTLISFSNIVLVEGSEILSIDYQHFKEYFIYKHILYIEFLNEIIARSEKIQSLVNREFIFDSVAKVAKMIYEDLDIFNKLKRQDISLILHIQPATLSRVLSRLKRNKIIDIVHGKVAILDFLALEKT
ncbi:MAG: Crp/Fnr family transcriptional regulator [Thiovulaceae bacterium]|nr:Crp/Fnr family transcriptional regulator [Sulfurimonadaceae bacterium]